MRFLNAAGGEPARLVIIGWCLQYHLCRGGMYLA